MNWYKMTSTGINGKNEEWINRISIDPSSNTIYTYTTINQIASLGIPMVIVIVTVIIIIIIIVEMTVAVKLWRTLLVESKKTNDKSTLPVTNWNFHRWVSNNASRKRKESNRIVWYKNLNVISRKIKTT